MEHTAMPRPSPQPHKQAQYPAPASPAARRQLRRTGRKEGALGPGLRSWWLPAFLLHFSLPFSPLTWKPAPSPLPATTLSAGLSASRFISWPAAESRPRASLRRGAVPCALPPSGSGALPARGRAGRRRNPRGRGRNGGQSLSGEGAGARSRGATPLPGAGRAPTKRRVAPRGSAERGEALPLPPSPSRGPPSTRPQGLRTSNRLPVLPPPKNFAEQSGQKQPTALPGRHTESDQYRVRLRCQAILRQAASHKSPKSFWQVFFPPRRSILSGNCGTGFMQVCPLHTPAAVRRGGTWAGPARRKLLSAFSISGNACIPPIPSSQWSQNGKDLLAHAKELLSNMQTMAEVAVESKSPALLYSVSSFL